MSKPDPRKNMETPWRDKERLQTLAKGCGSKVEMAEKLDTSRKTVARWMNKLDVEMVDSIPVEKSELRELYYELGTQRKVSEELGVSQGTVGAWMDKYEIKARKQHPERDLYDEEKMRQYYKEEQSIRGVSNRLEGNTGQGAVIKWLEKHGVETNHNHATRGEKIVAKCGNCGSERQVYESTIQGESWYCSQDCMAEGFKREITPERPYRGSWASAREKARSRDNNECQVCSSDSNLHVHHIVRVVEFEAHEEAHDLDNLVTVCQSCHPKLERLPEPEQRKLIQ